MNYFYNYCNKTINEINKALEKTRLVILCGDAGTGKSSLIKYMINNNLFSYRKSEIKYMSYFNKETIETDFNCRLMVIDNYDFVDNSDKFDSFVSIRNILEKTKVLLIQRAPSIEYDYKCSVIHMPPLDISSIRAIMNNNVNYNQYKKYGLSERRVLEITNGSILLLDLLNNYLQAGYNDEVVEDLLYVLSEKDKESVSQLLYVTAVKHYINNEFERAEELFFHIININTDESITIQSLYRIAEIKEKNQKYDEAIFVLKQIVEKTNEEFEISKLYNKIGELYRKTNSYKLALESFEFALSLINNCDNNLECNILTLELLINIASIYTALENYEKAINYLNIALGHVSANEEKKQYYLAVIYNNLAIIYTKQNDREKAHRLFHKAIEASTDKYFNEKQYNFLNSLISNNIKKMGNAD